MKKIILLTSSLFLLTSYLLCPAQNRIDNQGRRQGHWIKTDKDGSRIFEGDFKDGKEVGVFNYYYPDGTLKMRNTFTTPGRYCSHEAFDKQGKLIAKGYYNQKNRDSVWHFYNEEGKLIKIASYRMGIKEGNHIVFNSNGDTAEVTGWQDNRRHGRWWKRTGEKGYITGHYVKGGMEGTTREFDEKGKLSREGNYKNGVRHGSYNYYENGNMTVQESWQNGILADRRILLSCPELKWISIFSIAYYLPKGTTGTSIYLNNGTRLACSESPDLVSSRAGNDQFVLIDRKSRVMAAISSIEGIEQDPEGRDILKLSPKPPFTIFPDDECKKMVRSLNRTDELDQ